MIDMDKRKIAPSQSWKNLEKHVYLALHSEWYKRLFKLQSLFVNYTVDFYQKIGFDFALLPLTTGAISSPMGLGSDSKPVEVKIAGMSTYLADSMQFLLEYACRLNYKGMYYIAPSFRGEEADSRHLCQFYHSEAETVGTLDDVIKLVEAYLKYLVEQYLVNAREDILELAGSLDHIEKMVQVKTFPRCTFDEAEKILMANDQYIKSDKAGFRKITNEGEKKLMEYFDGFVWLTHFDHLAVPFYQKSTDKDFSKAICADLLMGIGETVGAGERHLNGQQVMEALAFHQIDQKEYQWYIDMKELVPIQTSGFGLGVERFFLWLLNHDDIRDMQLVPRFNGVKSIL